MSGSPKNPVKLKQLRLPFAPINKAEAPASSESPSASPQCKKRKCSLLSSKDDEPLPPEAKVLRTTSTRSSSRSSSRCSSPALVVSVPLESVSISELKETPSVKEKKRGIRVEIGRLSVGILEAKDAMEAAVETQDFLLAQKHKVQLDELTQEKEELQEKLNVHACDPSGLEAILKDIQNATPLRKAVQAEAAAAVAATEKGRSPSEATGSAQNKEGDILSKSPPGGTPSRNKTAEEPRKRKLTEEERSFRKEQEAKEKERRKESERIEKEKKKEAERLEKEKKKEVERLEKEKRRETERLEKERRKESERLEKERRKEAERLEKERKKNEDRLEKLRAEELLKRKQEKTVQSFASFFTKKEKTSEKSSGDPGQDENRSGSHYLNSFQVKSHMRLAPLSRTSHFVGETRLTLEEALAQPTPPSGASSYLQDIRAPSYTKGSCLKTWAKEEDEVEILEEEEEEDDLEDMMMVGGTVSSEEPKRCRRLRAKLLQFHENQRPPYWGTWSKSSVNVGGRRPFGRDAGSLLDYEYDSDEDWEEEEEQGESLSDDDEADEKEEEEEQGDEEEEDDGFFVGHGVLDKDEILHEDDPESNGEEGEEGGGEAYNEDLEIMKQKLKAQAFEEEYKRKKPLKLKPKVFGCLWLGEDDTEGVRAFAVEQLCKILSPLSAIVCTTEKGPIPTSLSTPASASHSKNPSSPQSGTPGGPDSKSVLKAFPEDAMFDLIRLVHANSLNKAFLSKEFATYMSDKSAVRARIPRRLIVNKIGEIAEYKKIKSLNRRAWIVKEELLDKYATKDCPFTIPNSNWTYVLEQPNAINAKSTPSTPKEQTESTLANPVPGPSGTATAITPSTPTPQSPLITNFVKVLTPLERERRMNAPGSALRGKKRATLICLSTKAKPPQKATPTTISSSSNDNT